MHSGVRPHLDPTYLRKPKCDLDMHVCACVCVRCLYMHVCVNISSAPHTSGNAHHITHDTHVKVPLETPHSPKGFQRLVSATEFYSVYVRRIFRK